MNKVKCEHCGKTLFFVYNFTGKIEIKCPRCGKKYEFERNKVKSREGTK